MKNGRIIPNGVSLERHEYNTILFLTSLGHDIELIPKSNQQGIHSPDIIFLNEKWEMKSPIGKGRWLLENTIQKASKQSSNIIIDLRCIKICQDKCVAEIEKQFYKMKLVKKIKVITKSQTIIDFVK